MKKSPDHIDQLFQSHFERHEVPIAHKKQLWRKIVIRSQRKSLGILFLLVLFLVTTGWIAYSQLETSDLNIQLSETVQNFTTTIDNKLVELAETTATIPTEVVDSKEEFNLENKVTETYEVLRITSSGTKTSSDKSLRTASRSTVTKVISEDNSAATRPENENTSIQKNKRGIEIQEINNTSSHNSTTSQLLEKGEEELALSILNNTSLNSQQADFQLPSIRLLAITPLPYLLTPPISAPKNGMMKKCEIGNKNLNPYVDVYGLLSRPMESVNLSTGSDQTPYLAIWEDRFDPLTSISAGVGVGNEWANGMSISVGLEYQRMESQYKARQTIRETTTIFDPMAFFFYEDNGQVVWVGDSVTSVTTFDRTVAHANTTTLLNLPIHLSYNLVQKGPWKIKATAGGIFNLSLQYRGKYLQADKSLILINDSNQAGIVTPRLGIGIEGGMHFGYLAGEKWEVYFSPRYRYNKSSYWDNSQVIQLSRDYLGLRTGVKYHF